MSLDHEGQASGFPWRLAAPFIVAAVGLVAGGMVLWWPERSGLSTARSDLGLALLGGGLALVAGFVVARAVFVAERSLDRTLQLREEYRERESLKLAI